MIGFLGDRYPQNKSCCDLLIENHTPTTTVAQAAPATGSHARHAQCLTLQAAEAAGEGTEQVFLAEAELKAETAATTKPTANTLHCASHANTTLTDTLTREPPDTTDTSADLQPICLEAEPTLKEI